MTRRSETPEARRQRAKEILRILRKEFPGQDRAPACGSVSVADRHDTFRTMHGCTRQHGDARPLVRYASPADFASADIHELEAVIRINRLLQDESQEHCRVFTGTCRTVWRQGAADDGGNGDAAGRWAARPRMSFLVRRSASSRALWSTRMCIAFRSAWDSLRKRPLRRSKSVLWKIFPRKAWIDVGSLLILHGRKTCNARKPKCDACSVNELCLKVGV